MPDSLYTPLPVPFVLPRATSWTSPAFVEHPARNKPAWLMISVLTAFMLFVLFAALASPKPIATSKLIFLLGTYVLVVAAFIWDHAKRRRYSRVVVFEPKTSTVHLWHALNGRRTEVAASPWTASCFAIHPVTLGGRKFEFDGYALILSVGTERLILACRSKLAQLDHDVQQIVGSGFGSKPQISSERLNGFCTDINITGR